MAQGAGLGRHALAGALAAVATGLLMTVLAGIAGGLSGSLPGILALTLPLLVVGGFYGWLLDAERMRNGFGPGILFWIPAFPLTRLAQELLVGSGTGPAEGIGPFLIYQALVGGAFGLGFVLLHNQIWGFMHPGGEEDEEPGVVDDGSSHQTRR